MSKRLNLVIPLLIVASLVLAACDGGGGDTAKVIKIATQSPLSGGRLRRFQIIEPKTSPKAVVVVGLACCFYLNIIVIEQIEKWSTLLNTLGFSEIMTVSSNMKCV